MVTLNIESRDVKKNTDLLRSSGLVPAVFYGKKEKSTPIAVKMLDFMRVWKDVGSSSVVTLKSAEADYDALVQDVQVNPVTGIVEHADFYVFEKGQKIEVHTPIEYVGNSPAVKIGGVLVKVLHELNIEAEPKDLPHTIEVDISVLVDFESVILAKDIKLGEGVTLLTGEDEVVASVYEPKEEAEEPEPVEFDPNAVEVEKKGKEATGSGKEEGEEDDTKKE